MSNKKSKTALSPAVRAFVDMLSMQIALRQTERLEQDAPVGDTVILNSMNGSRNKVSPTAAALAIRICATNWASYTSEQLGIPFEEMGLPALTEPECREAAAEFYRLQVYAFNSVNGRKGKSKAEKELGISRKDTIAMWRYLN